MDYPGRLFHVRGGASLFSLKAELVRKRDEAMSARRDQLNATEYGPSTRKKKALKMPIGNENDANKKAKDGEVFETEDSLLLEKSRRILEAKSRFYDRMARSGGGLNTDDNCLVLFNRKRQEEDGAGPSQKTSGAMRSYENYYEKDEVEKAKTVNDVDMEERKKEENEKNNSDSEKEEEYEDDLVEYTDCLGRTRKCLRKDLADCLQRDADLKNGISSLDKKPYWMRSETDTIDRTILDNNKDLENPKDELPNTKFEEQRAAWEIKEQENREKLDLHYQDVFFNEARLHGVSYFEFSTDPNERKKQQKELMDARRETLKQQSNYQKVKGKREELMKYRLFYARNRNRKRAGLKPFTRREFEEDYEKKKLPPLEVKEWDQEEELRKWKERREQRHIEVLQELDRRASIRPWDMGKEPKGSGFYVGLANIDCGWRYRGERLPMSQAEWNEKLRAERKPEFAPIQEPEPKPQPKLPIKPKRENFTFIPSLTAKPITGDFIPLHSIKPEDEVKDEEASNSSQASSDKDSKSNKSGTCGSDCSYSDNNSDPCSNSDTCEPNQCNHNDVVSLEILIDFGLKNIREQSYKGWST